MPVSFDFAEGTGVNITSLSGDLHISPVTYVESDDSGGGQSVTFTVSAAFGGGRGIIRIGQDITSIFGLTPINLNLSDRGTDESMGSPTFGNDVFTLRFQDSAGNNQLTGSGTNAVAFNVDFINGSFGIEYLTAGGGKVAGNNISFIGVEIAPLSLDGIGITGIRFTSLTDGVIDSIGIDSLTANALNCFTAGTQIATPEGEVAVESLEAGDEVLTADGSVSTVKWLGSREVDVRMGNPRKINPICISAGALGEKLPKRDLWVSRDHAIEIDGYLVNAGALVNGSTIYQVAQMPLDGFAYYHVEAEAHELLLAEGCPAESFIQLSKTVSFDNFDKRASRPVPEMDRPRIVSPRQVPASVQTRLVERAEFLRSSRVAA
jgi:hypothetical protein